MGNSASSWIQLLGLFLGSGVVTAIVQAIIQRRKAGTEADNAFVTTADTQRKGLIEDLRRAREERDSEHERANTLDQKVRQWWIRADRFMVWARRQELRNTERGVVDPMPELYPPVSE